MFSLSTFYFLLFTFPRRPGSLAVDLPRYAEAIDEHAKTLRPERFLERQTTPPPLASS